MASRVCIFGRFVPFLALWLSLALAPLPAAANHHTPWTNLKVRFDVNPFSRYYYQPMARHVSLLKKDVWIPISNGDCTNGGRYNGFRFVEQLELQSQSQSQSPALALLYDVQGTVAGIQMILDRVALEKGNDFRFDRVPFYNVDTVLGKEVYVITAYFVDPTTICTTGRPESELNVPARSHRRGRDNGNEIGGGSGTGTALLIQNGTTPDNLLLVPRTRKKALDEGWSKNECFIGMGNHNFYKVNEWAKKDCREIVPVFGLYDRFGDQIGFGFVVVGQVWRKHFENVPTLLWPLGSELIVGPSVPQCFLDKADQVGLTTMHVFFIDRANLITCLPVNKV